MSPNTDATTPTDGLPAKAAEVLAMVQALAPLYQGELPLAALWLEQQIRAGVLRLAVDGGGVKAVPLPDMATVLADTAHHFPGEPVPDADGDDVGQLLHQLHAHAGIYLDDDRVIRLAVLV